MVVIILALVAVALFASIASIALRIWTVRARRRLKRTENKPPVKLSPLHWFYAAEAVRRDQPGSRGIGPRRWPM
jgi:hypothetical protein